MIRRILIVAGILSVIISCNKGTRDVDLSGTDVNLNIQRFGKALFEADPSRLEEYIPVWKKEYGRFFELFNYRIIRIGSDENPGYTYLLRKFVTDYHIYQIYKRTMEVFPDLDFVRGELTDAFRHYKYYFPRREVPEIITYVSDINQSVVSDSGLLGIGLDDYLGVKEPLYEQAGIYNYLVKAMYKERIASDCMRLWAMTEFEYNDSVNNLINNMVYEGAVMYFVKQMIPIQPDSVIWGFSGNDLKFCRNNEKQMWEYLIEYKLLFSTDKFTIEKFIREGPFTKDFSSESPARAAVWIGYRIVQSYMQHHKNLTPEDLMTERDYQKILNSSSYNP